MEPSALALFVQAASSESLASAARRLRLSPLTASRRLAALEEELGVRLLNRTTRAITLTPEGEAFLPHAQAVLEAEALARESVRPTGRGVSGLLRVTVSVVFGRKVVVPVLADFMRAHPEVRVDLLLSDGLTDLVGEGLDLAIRIANPQDSGLVGRRIADNPRGLYAAPGYLAAHGAPRRLADLADHQCLSLNGVSHWTFQTGDGVRHTPVGGRFSANSIEGAHAAGLADLGIALLSDWAARDEVAEGRLVRVQLADAHPEPLAIWALHPTRRLVQAKVTAFVDALETALRA